MLHVLISENAFNPKSLLEVNKIQLEVEAEKNELLILEKYFDSERFKNLQMILRVVGDFAEKYNAYCNYCAVQVLEKEKIEEKKKNLRQEKEFIQETVEHFLEKYGVKVVPEIHKIGKSLTENLSNTVKRLYSLEKAAGIYISDISRIIEYKHDMEISEMLKEIG